MELRRDICFVNRQPTLFRHGMPGVLVVPGNEDDSTIGVSPLFVEPLNMDFDGDTAALYVPHDENSLRECLQKAFLGAYVHYDQNYNFLATIRHEILYGAYILTTLKPSGEPRYNVETLDELPEDISDLDYNISVAGKVVGYPLALFNKWCGFKKIKIWGKVDKRRVNYVSSQIYEDSQDNLEFYNRMALLTNRLLFFVSASAYCPTLDVEEMLILTEEEEKFFQNLPPNPNIGHLVNETLVNRILTRVSGTMRHLLDSGSRFNRRQFARSFVNIGYIANADNQIDPTPVRTNLLFGLSFSEFFASARGTKKSLIDKEAFTPQAGYLERTLVMGLSPVELVMDDCGDQEGFQIKVLSETHARTLIGKFARYRNDSWKVLTPADVDFLPGQEISIRSPITCQAPNLKICRTCFGTKWVPTQYVGVTAGQVLVERITQLILRTFHTSGAAEIQFSKELKTFFLVHLVSVDLIEEHFIVHFDLQPPEEIVAQLQTIQGFVSVEGTSARFMTRLQEILPNNDIIYYFGRISQIMRKARPVERSILEYYLEMMEILCEIGEIFSSYVEILFCNSFLVAPKISPEHVWRYNKASEPVVKLGRNQLAGLASGILQFLFTPNQKVLRKRGLMSLDAEDSCAGLNIYEKLLRY